MSPKKSFVACLQSINRFKSTIRIFSESLVCRATRRPRRVWDRASLPQDQNQDIVIPLTTDRSRVGDVITRRQQGSFTRERIEISQITVGVVNRHHVKPTAAALEGLLAKYHPKRRLCNHDSAGPAGASSGYSTNLQFCPWVNSSDFTVGRWYRHYEYHAGQCQ